MKRVMFLSVLFVSALTLVGANGCDNGSQTPVSDSGVSKASVQIPVGADGLTAEQRNIRDRLLEDNKPGSTKHLYVISAYSGQVLIYSTVRDKVTSSGKRLNPRTVESRGDMADGFPIRIGNWAGHTTEVVQDDGSYGSSDHYLFWWDTKGVYHQHYLSGGQILHIANQPIAVKSVVINMEVAESEGK